MRKILNFLTITIICLSFNLSANAAPIPIGGIITVIVNIPAHERAHSPRRNCNHGFSLCDKANHPDPAGLTVQLPTWNSDGTMTFVGYIYRDANNNTFVQMHFPAALTSDPGYVGDLGSFDIETVYNLYVNASGLNYDMLPGPAVVTTDVDGNLQATIPVSVH